MNCERATQLLEAHLDGQVLPLDRAALEAHLAACPACALEAARLAALNVVATLRAEVLTYSRARGLFAGISLEGSTLRPDNDGNERVYHKKVEAEDIVRKGAVAVAPSAQEMISLLNKKSPKNLSDPGSLKE